MWLQTQKKSAKQQIAQKDKASKSKATTIQMLIMNKWSIFQKDVI